MLTLSPELNRNAAVFHVPTMCGSGRKEGDRPGKSPGRHPETTHTGSMENATVTIRGTVLGLCLAARQCLPHFHPSTSLSISLCLAADVALSALTALTLRGGA